MTLSLFLAKRILSRAARMVWRAVWRLLLVLAFLAACVCMPLDLLATAIQYVLTGRGRDPFFITLVDMMTERSR